MVFISSLSFCSCIRGVSPATGVVHLSVRSAVPVCTGHLLSGSHGHVRVVDGVSGRTRRSLAPYQRLAALPLRDPWPGRRHLHSSVSDCGILPD